MQMDKTRLKQAADRVKGVLEDIMGLPPGDGTPHGQGRPVRDRKAPHGSLTADDAEASTAPKGTGISAE